MPEELIKSPLLGVGITVFAYRFGEYLSNRLRLSMLPPLLMAILLIMALIELGLVDYAAYSDGSEFFTFFLGIATIALAVPVVRNMEVLRHQWRSILAGTGVAVLIGVGSVWILGNLLGLEWLLTVSAIPKSVTVPVAMDIARAAGGLPSFTVACVIMSSIWGAVIGHKVLQVLGVKNDIAVGLAMGASSHMLGTSVCLRYSALQAAAGTIAIAMVAIETAILVPLSMMFLK